MREQHCPESHFAGLWTFSSGYLKLRASAGDSKSPYTTKQVNDHGCRRTMLTERETPKNVSYFLFHSAVHSVRGKSSLFAHLLERAESEGELYLRRESKTSLRKEKKKKKVMSVQRSTCFFEAFSEREREREKKKKKLLNAARRWRYNCHLSSQ